MKLPDIREIVLARSLPVKKNTDIYTASFNVRCPFCDDSDYHMNINNIKNVYSCVRCGTSGGVLDFYSRLTRGIPYNSGMKEELFSDLTQLGTCHPEVSVRVIREKEVKRASDRIVSDTYSALLQIPALRLSRQHQSQLLKRGLDLNDIFRNQYRSIPDQYNADLFGTEYIRQEKRYDAEKLEEIRKKQFPKINRKRMIAGLTIAWELKKRGATLKGVPGFFKVAHRWCFYLNPGLLIPVRNEKRQIVGFQIRKDIGKVKYVTLSSKHLPAAVNKDILRCHFVHVTRNPGKVFLTEGPLKADVASSLMAKKVMQKEIFSFIAIPGVNTGRKELTEIFKALKRQGVTEVYDALDLDRFTNVHVMKAVSEIYRLAKKQGIKMKTLVWADEAAEKKRMEFIEKIPKEFQMKYWTDRENREVFSEIAEIVKILSQKGVEFDKYWNSDTKGIDDYLSRL